MVWTAVAVVWWSPCAFEVGAAGSDSAPAAPASSEQSLFDSESPKAAGPAPLAAPVAAAPKVAPPAAAKLQQIEVQEGAREQVRLHLSTAVAPRVTTMPGIQPGTKRVAIDFPETQVGAGVGKVTAKGAVIAGVRSGVSKQGTTRVVVDVHGDGAHDVSVDGETLTVSFAPPSTPAPAAESETAAKTAAKSESVATAEEPTKPEPIAKSEAETKAAPPAKETAAKVVAPKDAKTESKSQAKAESKSEPKGEGKAAAKAGAPAEKPGVKIAGKAAPKPAPKAATPVARATRAAKAHGWAAPLLAPIWPADAPIASALGAYAREADVVIAPSSQASNAHPDEEKVAPQVASEVATPEIAAAEIVGADPSPRGAHGPAQAADVREETSPAHVMPAAVASETPSRFAFGLLAPQAPVTFPSDTNALRAALALDAAADVQPPRLVQAAVSAEAETHEPVAGHEEAHAVARATADQPTHVAAPDGPSEHGAVSPEAIVGAPLVAAHEAPSHEAASHGDSVHGETAHAAAEPGEPSPHAVAAHHDEPTGVDPFNELPTPPGVVAGPLAFVNGFPFVWPKLADPAYAAPAIAPVRALVARWERGDQPIEIPRAVEGVAATTYLAGDLGFLQAAFGRGDWFRVIETYERALAADPTFVDAPRAQMLIGLAFLNEEFGPEAEGAFNAVLKRYGDSPLAPWAALYRASAIRLRHRPGGARLALAKAANGATGVLACHIKIEEAAQKRDVKQLQEAASIYRTLASTCPDALRVPGQLAAYASALAETGARPEARALLAQAEKRTTPVEDAQVALLAGRLALLDGDGESARTSFDYVFGLKVPEAIKTEADFGLARLDAARNPARGLDALWALHDRPASTPVRAAIFGETAALLAKKGAYTRALTVLARSEALGGVGEEEAQRRRGEVLGRWIQSLHERNDVSGMATVYAGYATMANEVLQPPERLLVANALSALGLHGEAARLSLHAGADMSPDLSIVLAEESLAVRDLTTAEATANELLTKGTVSAPIKQRAQRVAVRAALLDGDLDGATSRAADGGEPALRAEVARAWMRRPDGTDKAWELLLPILSANTPTPIDTWLLTGDVASKVDAWTDAAKAYQRALDAGASGVDRTHASTGVARAEAAGADVKPAPAAVVQGNSNDPLVRAAMAASAAAAEAERRLSAPKGETR